MFSINIDHSIILQVQAWLDFSCNVFNTCSVKISLVDSIQFKFHLIEETGYNCKKLVIWQNSDFVI